MANFRHVRFKEDVLFLSDKGAGFLAIFHDEDVRARVADRVIDVSIFSSREAA